MDKLRKKSGNARPYFLSVRLSPCEVRQYATMLQWYELDYADNSLSASERFRMLLDKFTESIEVLDGSMKVFEQFLRRPPDWKDHT